MTDRITDKQADLLKKRGVTVDYNMSKQEASKLIDQILNRPKSSKTITQPQTEFIEGQKYRPRNYGSQSPMWGRYATDLLISMLGIVNKPLKDEELTALAGTAIQIVLSMRNQFKE